MKKNYFVFIIHQVSKHEDYRRFTGADLKDFKSGTLRQSQI